MTTVVSDYFRCPDDFPEFETTGALSQTPGYFSFGPDIICYGRSSFPHRGRGNIGELYDALTYTSVSAGVVRLPLDANEIVANLRYERYQLAAADGGVRLTDHLALRTLYYRLRDLVPRSIRRHVQKIALGDWRSISFPDWPVDGTVERFLERLLALSMRAQGVERVPFIWFWPAGAKSCVIMTHDVENATGLNFCSRLMDLDDSVGIKASFQLIPERRYKIPGALLDEIRARNFEINIHDLNHDGRLFDEHSEFLRRAQRINEHGRTFGALGFRSGALYRNHDWYEALDFSYDMSVPSTGRMEPQRGGCCSLMPFFIDRMLELPLTTTQDYVLFHILDDYSIDLWTRQLDAITERHGLASFLVHPDYVIEERAQTVYRALLAHLARIRREHNIWIALPGEVDHWWRQRSRMRIVNDRSGLRIEGEGRERARLAFATLAGDTVTFTTEGH
jgi:hypothetical protein